MTIENIYPNDTDDMAWEYFANSIYMLLVKLISADDPDIMDP